MEAVTSWASDAGLPPWAPGAALAVVVLVVVRLVRLARGRAGARPAPGEVWFAMVPFDDGSGAKDRPVLVLEVAGGTAVVAQLTSQDKGARRDHVRAPAHLTGLRSDGWLELRRREVRTRAFRRRVGDLGAAGLVWFEKELARLEPR